ncbi:MAG: acetylglutamate kinase [Phycisphaerales bacterium]
MPLSPSTPPLVIKLGGAALDDIAAATDLWSAVAEAHRVLEGRLILVHGGGLLVDRHLDRLGMTSARRDGIRITPPEQVNEIAAVLAGRVNKSIVGAMQAHGVPSVGLCLGDAHTADTRKADQYPFDPGRVGRVTGGDPTLLNALLEAAFLPVLSSIGLASDGSFLNINADDAAAAIASIVRARRLILLTDVPGILDEHRRTIASATPADIETLIARGVISGGMIPKANAAARAAADTGVPTTIASFKQPADLVRLARGETIGTTVVASRISRE